MALRSRAVLVVAVLLAARSMADEPNSAAEPAAARRASELVTASVELLRLEERERFWNEENDRLRHELRTAGGPTAFWRRLGKTPRDSFEHLVARVQSAADDLSTTLQTTAEQGDQETSRLEKQWTQVRTELYDEQVELEARGRRGENNVSDLGAAAAVVVAALSWAIASALITRHGWRRRVLGGAGMAVAAFSLLASGPVVGWWLAVGAPGRGWLTSIASTQSEPARASPVALGDGLDAVNQQCAKRRDAVKAAEQIHESLSAEWTKVVSEKLPASTALAADWLQARATLARAAVDARVAGRMATAIEEDQRQLTETVERHQEAAATAAKRQAATWRWKGFANAGLAGVLVASWLGLALGCARHRRREGRVCTKCQNVGTQELVLIGAGIDAGKYREYRCSAKWDDKESCDFRISDEYRHATKLCFPTVGLPLAGKTHWLAVTYYKLKCGGYPEGLDLQGIATKTMKKMDDTVADLRRPGVTALEATQLKLLDPLVFHVADRDRIVPGRVLLNVFDYSGEVVNQRDIHDPLRQRMLRANGLLLFIDPERDPDDQLSAMDRFLADTQRARLRVPAAVCLTKIDKFMHDQHASVPKTEFLQALHELSRKFNTGRQNLAVIEGRSRLTQRLVKGLWPDNDFQRRFRRAFGRGFRYFPITSTGFTDGVGQGEPQFVIEPLLWLLERNGYRIF